MQWNAVTIVNFAVVAIDIENNAGNAESSISRQALASVQGSYRYSL